MPPLLPQNCSSAWEMHEPENKIAMLTNTIRQFPKAFAQTKAVPFVHAFLYREKVPRPILEAWTACIAYTFRQPSNQDWVIRMLVENVNNVKRFQPISALDKLARVHALLLYQIIRIFDGDITLRARADDDMEVLRAWTRDLIDIRENLDDYCLLDATTVRERPPKSWGVSFGPWQLWLACHLCHSFPGISM
jgi:hypothetical protein